MINAQALARAVKRHTVPKAGMWWGAVTQVNPGSVAVMVNGDTQAITCLMANAYAQNEPQVGDTVFGYTDGDGDHWVIDEMGTSLPAWTNLTGYTNSWVSYGSPYAVASFRQAGALVDLRGLITGGASGAAAFTLPATFRPPFQVALGTVVLITGGTFQAGVIEIAPTGIATPFWSSGSGVFSLDGLSFLTN